MKEYITAEQIAKGKLIDPVQRIKLMSPDDWETLIEEWLDVKNKYIMVERVGGAGDMGRDVIAYIEDPKNNPNYKWDCYQCKHYHLPLSPSKVWIEFGKLLYYTFKKEFPIPEKYYFVAPLGIGSSLSTLLDDSESLKNGLKENWEKYCKNKIAENEEITLENDFLEYFNEFDFSIFDKTLSKTIVKEHKNHRNYLLRFGGGLPSRIDMLVPAVDEDTNLRYIEQLVKAYNSDSTDTITNVEDIEAKNHSNHFENARKSFYKVEELRVLSRDNLPERVFNDFQDEIYLEVSDTANDDFDNGFKKVKAVEKEARKTMIRSNPLKEVCTNWDMIGMCHHFVEESKISWIDDE
ncbi:MAG: hypothetical protein K0U38_05280 [Epsilonproteobacteria bacterium]|nr:hypothetical protein [Campylobacterota bacterium]